MNPNDSQIIIRCATVDDAMRLTELAARTFWDTFAVYNKAEDMQAYMSSAFTVTQIASEIADRLAKFFVAEINGELTGYAKLFAGEVPECITGTRPIELARLYVSQNYLGRGLGQKLLQACFDDAIKSGCQTMFLGVWEHNERAKAFYRKHGFREVGSHPFILGEDHQTDLWMERGL
ncbi:MAG TPA: GNAT family N-acetyltransferase [Blastocatellia bacterium]|nr:GNAT family N-acetyltransferase [Blastocatellia bacterium]